MMSKSSKCWNEDEAQCAVHLKAQGLSYSEITKELNKRFKKNFEKGFVALKLHKRKSQLRLPRKPRTYSRSSPGTGRESRWHEEEIDQAKNLYLEGRDIEYITERLREDWGETSSLILSGEDSTRPPMLPLEAITVNGPMKKTCHSCSS